MVIRKTDRIPRSTVYVKWRTWRRTPFHQRSMRDGVEVVAQVGLDNLLTVEAQHVVRAEAESGDCGFEFERVVRTLPVVVVEEEGEAV